MKNWASNISPNAKEVVICSNEEDAQLYRDLKNRDVLVLPEEALKGKFDFLKDSLGMFQNLEMIYLSVSLHGLGNTIRRELATRLGKENCKLGNFSGYKSVTEAYSVGGDNLVKKSLIEAVSFPLDGIITGDQIGKDMMRMVYDNGFTKGMVAGMTEFDRLYSTKRKLLTVLTGPPGTGKTEFEMTYDVNLIKHNPQANIRIAYFSPESRPLSRLKAKLAMIYMNKPIMEGTFNRASLDEYDEACRWVDEHFVFIHPGGVTDRGKTSKTKGPVDLKGLLGFVRTCVRHHGIIKYVGDPWNKVEHQRPPGLSEKEYISKSLDLILDNADYNDVATTWIAHPTKTQIDKVSKNKHVISLADISGAAEWESKADIGIVLHRPLFEQKVQIGTDGKPTNKKAWEWNPKLPTDVMVQKMKFEEIGALGVVPCYYNLFGGKNFVEKKSELTELPSAGHQIGFDLPTGEEDNNKWKEDDVPF